MKWTSFLFIFILTIVFSFVVLPTSVHALSLNDIINYITSIFTGQSSTSSINAGIVGGGTAPTTTITQCCTTSPNSPPCPPDSQPCSTSITIQLSPGWNMFSLPIIPNSQIQNNCNQAGSFWHYDPTQGQYVQVANLNQVQSGLGYWMNVQSSCTLTLSGNPISINDFPQLNSGWNQIGSPTQSTTFSPGNCNLISGPWWYDPVQHIYVNSNNIEPGKGYWIKVSDSCSLSPQTSTTTTTSTRTTTTSTSTTSKTTTTTTIVPNIEIQNNLVILKNKKEVIYTDDACQLPEKIAVSDSEVMKYFYSKFDDSFDYAIIVTNFNACQATHQINIKNEIQGIGLNIFDASNFYGSNGRLKGLVRMESITGVMLNSKFFFLHEFGHNWGVFINSNLKNQFNHWDDLAFLDSCDVMSATGSYFENVSGNYSLHQCSNEWKYSYLTQYLMGLLSKENITTEKFYLMEWNNTLNTYKINQTFTISDIIALNGERVPKSDISQKNFNVAFILVTNESGASADEISALQQTMQNYKNWFGEATDNRGNITFSIACTDSDGGKNYYVKGTTIGTSPGSDYPRIINATDKCGDSTHLYEYSCFYTKNVVDGTPGYYFGSETYECPYGCIDGACIKTS